MQDIKTGSVVRLASGGPKMTVGSINEKVVICYWFDYDPISNTYGREVLTSKFGLDMLVNLTYKE